MKPSLGGPEPERPGAGVRALFQGLEGQLAVNRLIDWADRLSFFPTTEQMKELKDRVAEVKRRAYGPDKLDQ